MAAAEVVRRIRASGPVLPRLPRNVARFLVRVLRALHPQSKILERYLDSSGLLSRE